MNLIDYDDAFFRERQIKKKMKNDIPMWAHIIIEGPPGLLEQVVLSYRARAYACSRIEAHLESRFESTRDVRSDNDLR